MSYYFEIWLRGYAKDHMRRRSDHNDDYHPHITLVRPFAPYTSKEEVRVRVREFCKEKNPVPFTIGEERSFPEGTRYLAVQGDELLAFNDGLEAALAAVVVFKPKLSDTKILHATLETTTSTNVPASCDEKIEQYMLRLTGIENKRIWYSYDFVTGQELDREQSLDKELWHRTVTQFRERTGLRPTPSGFVRHEQ